MHLGLRRVDQVDPERLVQDLGRDVVGGGRALELLLEVLVRLLVVLEVELVDERRERVGVELRLDGGLLLLRRLAVGAPGRGRHRVQRYTATWARSYQ